MRIRSIETFKINLPFRFAFGHSLASRAESSNLIVKTTLEDGSTGYGEGVPRDYVTGETVESAENQVLHSYAPELMDLDMDDPVSVKHHLLSVFQSLGLDKRAQGASWCALELSMLDCLGRLHGKQIRELIGVIRQKRIRYGGVIPFGGRRALTAVLCFYKLCGYGTVKLKVGSRSLDEDIEKLRLTREIMGKDCKIRVDANCAWKLDQALRAAEAFRPFGVLSYEQPFAAEDWKSIKDFSDAVEEDVMVDESLCTIAHAETLARERICDAFNVRVSKAGGLLAAQKMIDIARSNGLRVHLGAQVGESGILSAAARHLAVVNEPMENYEGSANFLLLKNDICKENLTAGFGGYGDLKFAAKTGGLGVNIIEKRLLSMATQNCESEPEKSSINGAQASEVGSGTV